MINRNKIGLGTVQFGLDYGISNSNGKTSQQEVESILQVARKFNINILDSASGYGDAEKVLGKNSLEDFNIVSKFLPPASGYILEQQIEQTLSHLKIKKLYAYLAHRPLDLLSAPDQWKQLEVYRKEGIIGKIGFSLNEPRELKALLKAGIIPDLVQVPYNYFDRRFENTIKDLRDQGCEIHTRSAFLQGLFGEVKPILRELHKNYKPLPGRLLNFVINKPFIDKVIIGVENSQQLKQNIRELEKASSLPELDMKISNNILIPSRWPKK
jgi:aryl-alcohol dehydrogenase-like predicted oxidoreductase